MVTAEQAAPTARSPQELVRTLQEKYQRLESFWADFEQSYTGPEQELREAGAVGVKKPGRMYWEYRKPIQKYFVVDGDDCRFYVPKDRQVVHSKLDRDAAGAPLLFLLGKGDLERDFQALEEQEEKASQPGNWMLRLVPRAPQGEFEFIVLEVTPGTQQIARLIVVEPIGNRNEYRFTSIQENVKIPDRLFKLDIPPGVEVVRQ
jgi:outer membrane lipoprotein carrier protein